MLEVRRSTSGPQIFVSRTHKGFLKRLFELEVPEIHSGTVEIKAIAREAGSRSKVAVASRQEGLDPVGATVGQRGARVQAVVAELSGEKIDVIPWNDDAGVFVANALSPAQVISVDIDEEHRIASVTVPERMLSLAIGREGQNARLAARLTGWRIDIRSDVSVAEARAAADAAPAVADEAPEAVAADARRGARQAQARDQEGRRGRRGDRRRGAGRGRRRGADVPAKPKRVTKKAAAASAEAPAAAEAAIEAPPSQARDQEGRVAADATDAVPAEAVAEAPDVPAKPKRATKKAAGRRGGGVVGRPPTPSRRGASRPAPASPVGRSARSGSCCGSFGRRTARSSPTRPAGSPAAAPTSADQDACHRQAITKGALSRALHDPAPDRRQATLAGEPSPPT